VDRDSIERVRSATFPVARRGYDQREVDRFLSSLADWLETGGADQGRSDLIRRELERIGEETGRLLTEAHDIAERLRVQAEREAEGLIEGAQTQADRTRAEADRILAQAQGVAEAAAQKLRTEADKYATQKRMDADHDSEQTLRKARAEAKRIVDEASTRKRDVEAVIADLEARRDEVLASLERLSTELAGTATEHAREIAERATDTGATVQEEEDGAGPAAGDEEQTQQMPATKGAPDEASRSS
jgi:DivIVA domain-containing protein